MGIEYCARTTSDPSSVLSAVSELVIAWSGVEGRVSGSTFSLRLEGLRTSWNEDFLVVVRDEDLMVTFHSLDRSSRQRVLSELSAGLKARGILAVFEEV
jgi:hypothetical protein